MKEMHCVKRIFLATMVFGLLLQGSVVIGEIESLDGKSFLGQMGQQGSEKGNPDEFIFKEGKFRSIACNPYGFGDAPYTASANEDMMTFEAETHSPTDGVMQWKGTVTGEKIEGTATWLKPGAAPVEYWFKAELKKQS